MGHHKVEINVRTSRGGRGKKSSVKPGRIPVKHGDSVTWNAQHSDAILYFPNGNPVGDFKEKEIAKGSHEFTVRPDVDEGSYPYAVYCKELNDFAEGNSFPIMIVR